MHPSSNQNLKNLFSSNAASKPVSQMPQSELQCDPLLPSHSNLRMFMDPIQKAQTPEDSRERALVGEKRSYAQYEGMFGEEDGGLRTPLSREVKEKDIFEKGRNQTGKSAIGVKIGNRQMRPVVMANLGQDTGTLQIFSADFLWS